MRKMGLRVALVSMPWAPLLEPSLGLAITSSSLTNSEIENRIFHLNLRLLKYLKYTTYDSLASMFGVNESILMYTLNGLYNDHEKELAGNTISRLRASWNDARTTTQIMATILQIHEELGPKYIEECSREIERYDPTIVGLTCMFDQIGPSLALAEFYKKRNPDVTIVLGGYAVSGNTGKSIEHIDFVDYVFDGESEERFPRFCLAIHDGDRSSATELSRPRAFVDLDQSPTPTFEDYFHDLKEMEVNEGVKIRPLFLPLDSSRGCWWGQKHHCTFCGIRSSEMSYRSKSISRFVEQVHEIRDSYGCSNIRISDYILPRHYLNDEAANMLEETNCRFSTEMKSNVRPSDGALLKRAGFVDVQIGVESFCDKTLQAISKGVSALQNVRAICILNGKGIDVAYNIIHGILDDEEHHFRELSTNVWRLHHLSAPASFIKLAITADSPICIQLRRENLVVPHPVYELVYGKRHYWARCCNTEEIAYYFFGEDGIESPSVALFRAAVQEWRRAYRRGASVNVRVENGRTIVDDTRRGKVRFELSNRLVDILLYAGDRIVKSESIENEFRNTGSLIDELWRMGMIFRINEKFVSLVPGNALSAYLGMEESVSSSGCAVRASP